ncbi:hypothetical protein KFE94_11765 [bacterium SCSIO 12643]|nr:hypothetical protein KFE94_11765 [bacterium SCSIO 12643]
MKRAHYISGLTITLFVIFHIINHLFSVFGADQHIAFMNKIRWIYRQPIFEAILLISVAMQIITGLNLFRSKFKAAQNRFEKLQVWSGLYLAIFFLIHVSAVLTGRYILELDTNFYFGVAGLNTFPLNLFFMPYYSLAVMALFGHIAAIHYSKMTSEIFGLSVKNQTWIIILTGIIVSIIILFGSTNGFKGIEVPPEYHMVSGK